MPKKGGTEDSSTIHFFSAKMGWSEGGGGEGGVRVCVEMGAHHHSDNK